MMDFLMGCFVISEQTKHFHLASGSFVDLG
jgi:hypothetical protein